MEVEEQRKNTTNQKRHTKGTEKQDSNEEQHKNIRI